MADPSFSRIVASTEIEINWGRGTMKGLHKRWLTQGGRPVGLLGVGLAFSLGGLVLQGPVVLLRFHRYVTGDFQVAHLPLLGLISLLLPGLVLGPLMQRWARQDGGSWQAWRQVGASGLLNLAYGLLLLTSLDQLAPLPRETAILTTPLGHGTMGAFLEAGGGLCFWFVALGISQLWLGRDHPRLARWWALSLVPLLPVIAGLSTRYHAHLGAVAAGITAVVPFLGFLIPGAVFGLVVSYVNRASQRQDSQRLAVTIATIKNRHIAKDVTVQSD